MEFLEDVVSILDILNLENLILPSKKEVKEGKLYSPLKEKGI